MKKKAALWILAAAVACGGAWLYWSASRRPTQEDLEREFERMEPNDKELGDFKGMDIPLEVPPKAKGRRAKAGEGRGTGKAAAAADGDEAPAAAPTEEEKAEAEADRLVEDFDALTDKWTESANGRTPTMDDVDAFVEKFRRLPTDRKDECIHRALNLIPDENVMLLAGVLMDKGQDAEIVDAVFSDILNRDESVKLPVLREVIKDTKHPCWKDAAWILDVTKQLPADR
ncbi:MAG: hypothetical protein J6T51_03835 [Kiritimatiellae bacterium]|nr:hypothetical protein [Kiritimatiellia bacterium]